MKFHIFIQSLGVDLQHAVIEFSSEENCFVLQDLNTQHGTYINDCRVQNAAVRLAPNDLIRFGASGVSYELVVEGSTQVSFLNINQFSFKYNKKCVFIIAKGTMILLDLLIYS